MELGEKWCKTSNGQPNSIEQITSIRNKYFYERMKYTRLSVYNSCDRYRSVDVSSWYCKQLESTYWIDLRAPVVVRAFSFLLHLSDWFETLLELQNAQSHNFLHLTHRICFIFQPTSRLNFNFIQSIKGLAKGSLAGLTSSRSSVAQQLPPSTTNSGPSTNFSCNNFQLTVNISGWI